jgi:beta-lactamase regulating signal transducer with metallopeptidase domain
MIFPDVQTLAQLCTGRLLNTAAEGIVLAGLVRVLFRLIGPQSSRTRFAIWFSALVVIVALPFLSGSGFGALHSRALSSEHLRAGIILSSAWASYLFAFWGLAAGLLLLRLSVGFWRVGQIRSKCSDADLSSLDPTIPSILADFGARRRVKLCVSSDVAVPAAIGFFRPAIVFPAWLLPQLSPEETKVVLLHELAHLNRWDDWTNLAQKIVKAVFFFHPAVWWIESRLTLEREMACDDMVLAQTASPRAYASSLISFAEKLQNARALTLAQALVSRMRDMSLRVAQILDTKQRPSCTGLWKPVLGLSAGMLALVFSVAPYAPPLIAFRTNQNQTPSTQAAHSGALTTVADAAVTQTWPTLDAQIKNQARLPRAIPAKFTIRTTESHAQIRAIARRKTPVISATAAQQPLPMQATFVVLQTTQYDASGSAIWTLCIWRVGGGSLAERQLESAIIASFI